MRQTNPLVSIVYHTYLQWPKAEANGLDLTLSGFFPLKLLLAFLMHFIKDNNHATSTVKRWRLWANIPFWRNSARTVCQFSYMSHILLYTAQIYDQNCIYISKNSEIYFTFWVVLQNSIVLQKWFKQQLLRTLSGDT